MKIIKVGTLPQDIEHNAECLHCHTQVTFKQGEARRESSCRNESFLVVTCPLCRKEIWHEI